MQGELDGTLAGVRTHCEDLRGREELLRHHEQLVHSLKELLSLGLERIEGQLDLEPQSRTQLQEQLSRHTVRVKKSP